MQTATRYSSHVLIASPASTFGAAASFDFFLRFEDPDDLHYHILSPAERRLIAEWLDVGAQYYNNPFDAPANCQFSLSARHIARYVVEKTNEWRAHARSLICCVCIILAAAGTGHAAEDPLRQVAVADPYLELHTGPGRGYPVFHVVERGESVSVVLQRTDWYLVRTDRAIEGWVNRDQMELTLTAMAGISWSIGRRSRISRMRSGRSAYWRVTSVARTSSPCMGAIR